MGVNDDYGDPPAPAIDRMAIKAHAFVLSDQARHDVEAHAERDASRTDRAVLVHEHPRPEGAIIGDPSMLADCNSRCRVVLPDPAWAGGKQ